MTDMVKIPVELAWPVAILLAWIAGEFVQRWIKLPRISVYAIAGFTLGASQLGLLSRPTDDAILLLANIAFGLMLYECGYRMNLHWLRVNPWIAVTSIAESSLTFCAVLLFVSGLQFSTSNALLVAALSMATSPAAIIRVINEQRSSGQVTERSLHLSAMNCVLAVFAFKVIVGLVIFQTSGNIWQAVYGSLIVLMASVVTGASFGIAMPMLLRSIGRASQDSTLAFAIAVILLVTFTHSLKLSPILATLTFGLVSRHRRIVLNASQRSFGALGDLLGVLLFVFIAATLEWRQVIAGLAIGLGIILVRLIAKLIGISAFAHWSGMTWRKGLLLGVAMTPISAFVILVLEQTRYLGIGLADQLAPLAATSLMLEILGPILFQRVLIWAREVPQDRSR